MAGPKEIQQIIENAVGEVFDSQLAKLRAKVIEKVLADLEPVLSGRPTGTPTDQLNSAVGSVYDVSSQAEILGALLDGASKFSGRAVLFVVRGGEAKGWRARGFDDDNAVKAVTLDTGKGLLGRAMQDRMPVAAAAAEFDSQFTQDFGNPGDGNALVLPLVVKDKIAAFIYADAGMDSHSKIDASALQLLVRDAGLWLELLTLRKSGGAVASTAAEHSPAEPMIAPPEKVTESSIAAVAAAAPIPEPPPTHPSVPVNIPPEDEEVHKKARRFAKLLVDEIKLYNQAKVNEGRQNRDVFDRLREDIEKSRATYDKRYGHTPAAAGDYFTAEVIRVLADNDRSLMGDAFPQ
ncbi:MAG: GAF domain-containing protein [Candidatus Koribacter versatilis]|uniref:GAF domain-containing protein n=1 Tax=Candidatus Korobacter versatilis TaxID=658062 RepID=A0A932A7B9_9BACT|nr:GAF domain-containing protein [Candidatus Koribacter versatilis]